MVKVYRDFGGFEWFRVAKNKVYPERSRMGQFAGEVKPVQAIPIPKG
jgi:hypothetical protein